MLYQIIYVSSAIEAVDRSTYQNIALNAVKYNQGVDITGMMILYNGAIIQVLEGSKDTVTSLYEKIFLDQRHKNPITLYGDVIEKRDFPNWSMGFEHSEEYIESEFMFRIKSKIPEDRIPDSICPRTQALLKSYQQVSGLEVGLTR